MSNGRFRLPRTDRRGEPRYDFLVPIHLAVLSESDLRSYHFQGETLDVSAGGILVQVSERPEDFYELLVWDEWLSSVCLPLPKRKGAAVFPGKVVWCDYRHHDEEPLCVAGILFDQLPFSERRFLNALLSQLYRQASSAQGL